MFLFAFSTGGGTNQSPSLCCFWSGKGLWKSFFVEQKARKDDMLSASLINFNHPGFFVAHQRCGFQTFSNTSLYSFATAANQGLVFLPCFCRLGKRCSFSADERQGEYGEEPFATSLGHFAIHQAGLEPRDVFFLLGGRFIGKALEILNCGYSDSCFFSRCFGTFWYFWLKDFMFWLTIPTKGLPSSHSKTHWMFTGIGNRKFCGGCAIRW